ncbi:MauE/DoxX family redox-associated membrane protein [Pedobacter helvus]|uniref:MauE/DoxX family redox-associated membrane protein n=1 Tax=Pedobacter helvus TaxID=2563444 RepID=A0ABW9JM68_9SPHI|nr:MauE/DoxX family redox-associated membrane protein [Pedobacter ureilyticus]
MGHAPIVADTTYSINRSNQISKTMNNISISNKQPFLQRDLTKQLLIWGIKSLCIFLLLYTANEKIADHKRFYKGLTKIQFLTDYALTISWLVPITEIAVALAIILPWTQKLGLYLFTIMMGIFTFYIASMLLWAEKKPCHCGGAIEMLTWEQHLVFNISFILMAIFGIYLHKNENQNLNFKN